MMKFEELIGKRVIYTSGSGKEYEAFVTMIPSRPEHAYSPLPTVSLEFRDNRNKLVRKERVIPEDNRFRTCVYRLP